MSVDSSTKTISFSGSDSGTMATVEAMPGFFVGEVEWIISANPIDAFMIFDLSAVFTESPDYGGIFDFELNTDGSFFLSYFAVNVAGPAMSFGTTAASIDYSGLNASQMSALEGISGSFGLTKGSFSNLQLTQVPEPAATALVIGMLSAGLIFSRRQR